ncbi:MAG: PHP domain-containing protein [Anaerolineae bacterium]
MSRVDLHLHTTASDGVYTSARLVALAARRGLRAIAITDHDSTEGLDKALVAAKQWGIEVIPGVELSTDVSEGEVHILGYFIDWHDPELQETLTRLRASRVERARKMVDKLAALGVPVSFQRVLELAGEGAVGRPHVAKALVEAGHVMTTGQAFNRYLGRHGPAYVERYRLSPVEAVQVIRRARGLPVLAHPLIPDDNGVLRELPPLESFLPELCAAGLVGLEAYYTGYPPAVTRDLTGLAAKFGLIVTGGSDFHGGGILQVELGEVYVPWACVERLKALHRAQRNEDEVGV